MMHQRGKRSISSGNLTGKTRMGRIWLQNCRRDQPAASWTELDTKNIEFSSPTVPSPSQRISYSASFRSGMQNPNSPIQFELDNIELGSGPTRWPCVDDMDLPLK